MKSNILSLDRKERWSEWNEETSVWKEDVGDKGRHTLCPSSREPETSFMKVLHLEEDIRRYVRDQENNQNERW